MFATSTEPKDVVVEPTIHTDAKCDRVPSPQPPRPPRLYHHRRAVPNRDPVSHLRGLPGLRGSPFAPAKPSSTSITLGLSQLAGSPNRVPASGKCSVLISFGGFSLKRTTQRLRPSGIKSETRRLFMKNAKNMTADGGSPAQFESTLFSNLFNGKTALEANDEFSRFLNSTHVVPFWISTPAQTPYASMACGNWTTTRKKSTLSPEPSTITSWQRCQATDDEVSQW